MDYLDFEPGQRTLEAFRDDPAVLIGVLDWWWESAVESYYSIEAGLKPEPRRGFFSHTRHLVFWCDAELRTLDAAPLQELTDQIWVRIVNTACPCGGKGIAHCNRCGKDLRDARWTEPPEIERTLAKAHGVKERILALALAANKWKWESHKAAYPNHDRDKFIYESRWESKTWKEIAKLLKSHPEWEQVEDSAMRKAGDTYATRCNRPALPRGKRGRPPKAKTAAK